MQQTLEERRLHHQTREDRRRKVYEVLTRRLQGIGMRYAESGTWLPYNLEAAQRDADNLARKLNL